MAKELPVAWHTFEEEPSEPEPLFVVVYEYGSDGRVIERSRELLPPPVVEMRLTANWPLPGRRITRT